MAKPLNSWRVWIPFSVIVFSATLAFDVYYGVKADYYDIQYGRGATTLVNPEGKTASYYGVDQPDNASMLSQARQTAYSLALEGEVLLKNDGVLPLEKKAAITPFGYRYASPIYEGTGSAKPTGSVSHLSLLKDCLAEAFTVNEEVASALEKATPVTLAAITAEPTLQQAHFSNDLLEFDSDFYAPYTDSISGTTGLIFIARQDGEGLDLQRSAYSDGTPHELALTSYEKATISFAKAHCEKTIVILNCAMPLECEPLTEGEDEVDAILWVGYPGSSGFLALTDLLTGAGNPSGHLPDIYPTSFAADPVWPNFGSFTYENADSLSSENISNGFIEYQEGPYLGYRYYETASDLGTLTYGAVDSKGHRSEAGAVLYPFGYGLSYTSFDQQFVSLVQRNKKIEAVIRVTNTGARNGKAVAQLYGRAPYTVSDITHGVEKPTVSLLGFDKTPILAPSESVNLTISFDQDALASYQTDYVGSSGEKGAYVMEAGTYEISLRENSHDVITTKTFTLPETQVLSSGRSIEKRIHSPLDSQGKETTPTSFVAPHNLFNGLDRYLSSRGKALSRSDFSSSFPKGPISRLAPDFLLPAFQAIDFQKDPTLGETSGSIVYQNDPVISSAKNHLLLSQFRGLDSSDAKWDKLMDQIDYSSSEIRVILFQATFGTSALESIGLMPSLARDAPNGIALIDGVGETTYSGNKQMCLYPCEPIIAASFNRAIAREEGRSIAQESRYNGPALSQWYGPGMNLHRSPFNGRVFEYYSEDPLLTGVMAANCVSGASSEGVVPFIKHFLANNQETGRVGLHTWMSEQTLRELYLTPYEIVLDQSRTSLTYLDEAGKKQQKVMRGNFAIMSSKNAIGAEPCNTNYALSQSLLREEWGFAGILESDMVNNRSTNCYTGIFRSGTDLIMQFRDSITPLYWTSNTSRHLSRQALRHVAYSVVNSYAMEGIYPGGYAQVAVAPWFLRLIGASAAGYLLSLTPLLILSVQAFRKRRKTKR